MTRYDKNIRMVDHEPSGFWAVILVLLKAVVWPAYVLHHVLQAPHEEIDAI